MNAEELCSRYEVKVSKHKLRPLDEDEIIVIVWANICNTLQEQSFSQKMSMKERKSMRMASRLIRCALAQNNRKYLKDNNRDILRMADAKIKSVGMSIIEALVMDVDEMARLINGGHPLKRRLNACRIRIVHVVSVLSDNLQHLKILEDE